MPTPGDYDIVLNADIQFATDMEAKMSTAVSAIFTKGFNELFDDMSKVLVKSFADAMEKDLASTDKIGKAILQGIARQAAAGRPGQYAPPMGQVGPGGPPVSPGGYTAGPSAYGTSSDILSDIAGQNIDQYDIGQIATGKLGSRTGGPIGAALRSPQLNKFIGGRLSNRRLKQMQQEPRYFEKGMEQTIDTSQFTAEQKASGAMYEGWEKAGMAAPKSMADMATAAEAGPAVEGMGEVMSTEAMTGAAGTAAGIAAPIAAAGLVAKAGLDATIQQRMATWKTQGAMIGGPGASGGAASSAAWLSMAGMEKTGQVIEDLGKSDLTFKEMNASVDQATKAVYGYGMTTGTTSAYLKYQYEILGNSTTKAGQELDTMAGRAAAAGMSVEQFAQMSMGAASTLQAAGYGAASAGGGTAISESIRKNIPGMNTASDANKFLGKMPTTPLGWQAAQTRLGVPLTQMGPSMMGGTQGDYGSTAWMIGEAKYAQRMFGGNREMAVQYLQSRFGVDMEQAAAFYDKYGAMDVKTGIAQAKRDDRREAAMAKRVGEQATGVQKFWGRVGGVLKFVPGMGAAGEEVQQYGVHRAADMQEQYNKMAAGQHAKYGTEASLVGGAAGLTTTQTADGGLLAQKGGLTVQIVPTADWKAKVVDTVDTSNNIFSQSRGSSTTGGP